jgi:hypothetical protein
MTEVYFVGGSDENPSLIADDYEVSSTCFKVNLLTGELIRKAPLIVKKEAFGICNIGRHIYAVGGRQEYD